MKQVIQLIDASIIPDGSHRHEGMREETPFQDDLLFSNQWVVNLRLQALASSFKFKVTKDCRS